MNDKERAEAIRHWEQHHRQDGVLSLEKYLYGLEVWDRIKDRFGG